MRGLQERGVLVRAGGALGSDTPALRVTYGLPEENARFLDALARGPVAGARRRADLRSSPLDRETILCYKVSTMVTVTHIPPALRAPRTQATWSSSCAYFAWRFS